MPDQVLHILVAEDEDDQVLLLKECFLIGQLKHELHFVKDGEDLLHYLNGTGNHINQNDIRLPNLILLDLSMPKKDGRAALKELKSSPTLKHIPIIVMSTSNAPFDIAKSYEDGANAYICKPYDFNAFIKVMTDLTHYWSHIAALPP